MLPWKQPPLYCFQGKEQVICTRLSLYWPFVSSWKNHYTINACLLELLESGMAMVSDWTVQNLDFSSCGEEEEGSDSSLDEWSSSNPQILSPNPVCRTPIVQRHCTRSFTVSPSIPVSPTTPIPYAAWRKLRLCDSPSTPKVCGHLSYV